MPTCNIYLYILKVEESANLYYHLSKRNGNCGNCKTTLNYKIKHYNKFYLNPTSFK